MTSLRSQNTVARRKDYKLNGHDLFGVKLRQIEEISVLLSAENYNYKIKLRNKI